MENNQEFYSAKWYLRHIATSSKKDKGAWADVLESLNEAVAISKVPLIAQKSIQEIESEALKLCLALGLNPRTYDPDYRLENNNGQPESINKIYKKVIQEHAKYYDKGNTRMTDKSHRGGGIDRTRGTIIKRVLQLNSQVSELAQIDLLPFRTYNATELMSFLKQKGNEEEIDVAFDETFAAISEYAKRAEYIYVGWGKEVNDFLVKHPKYGDKLAAILSEYSAKIYCSGISEGDNPYPSHPNSSHAGAEMISLADTGYTIDNLLKR